MKRDILLTRISLVLVVGLTASVQAAIAQSTLPLRTVADVPLTGNTGRLDYESFDPRTGVLYLAHMGADSVIAVDIARRRVVATVEGTPTVRGVLAVPELRRVYAAAEGTSQVVVIDAQAMRVVARVDAGNVDGLAYDPKTQHVFVSDESGGKDTVIDAKTNRVVAHVQLGGQAGNTVYDPASGHVFVAVQTSNDLAEIDPLRNQIVRRYPVPECLHGHGLVVDPQTHVAFVACQGNARLVALDLRDRRSASAQIGSDPDVVALDEGLHRLYVAAESGTLSVFDVSGGALRKLGQGFYAPDAHVVSVDSKTHQVFFPLRNVGGRPVLRIAVPLRYTR